MKHVISFILSIVLLLSFLPKMFLTVSASDFTDLNPSSMDTEVFEAIMYVSDNGYMGGTGDSHFSPDMNMTRAQIVQIFYSMTGHPYVNIDIPFVDVPSSAWYYNAVCWAYANGITGGTSQTTFSPNQQIQLQDAILMLYRFALLTNSYTVTINITGYSDYDSIAPYARLAMRWAAQYCIVQPDGSNMVYPTSQLIRAKQALFLCRYDKNAVGFFDGKKKFSFLNANATNTMTSSRKALLLQIINNHFSTAQANQIANQIDSIYMEAQGKCFAMCAAMLFDANGRLNFNKKVGNYNTMAAVPSFLADSTVRDWINFYKLGECAALYSRDLVLSENSLLEMCTNIQNHGPTIMSFFFYYFNAATGEIITTGEVPGHSVIITSMKPSTSGTGYDVEYYDPNQYSKQTGSLIFYDHITIGSRTLNNIFFFNTAEGTIVLRENYGLSYYSSSSIDTLKYLDCDGEFNVD